VTETRKTLAIAGAALLLVVLVWAVSPRRVAPDRLQDRGQPFFPAFTDPNAASALEVVEFDEQTSVARPFKVLNRDGRWTIPSKSDYPADGSHRLSSIAAALIALRKDDLASDSVSDEERCGVLDPLDETLPALTGRGTRITVEGQNDRILADVIVGKIVEGRPLLRYVRLPRQKRTYVARVADLNVSTRFEDWIERNLLQVERDDIDQIVIRNYTVDAKSGRVTNPDTLALRKHGKDLWAADGAEPTQQIDAFKVNLLVTKLADLTIVDVRPKPVGVTTSLTGARAKLAHADVIELESRGFYFAPDGRLMANRGEVLVHTVSGLFFSLLFGEVASADRRYLFISVGFDPGAAPGPTPEAVRSHLDVLRARFAPWYYVISDDSFRKIRLQHKDVFVKGP
jgi:Domain of unknown function (DUF4340)